MEIEQQQLVGVVEACSEVELLLYRTILQEAGMNVSACRVGEAVIPGDIFRVRSPHYCLLVHEDDAESAKLLIAEYQRQVESGELTTVSNADTDEVLDSHSQFSRPRWFITRLALTVVVIAVILLMITVIPQLLHH